MNNYSLKKELNADRVKNYSAKMAAGLTYNYAAKQVNDQILGVMQNLADEMELTGKFAELYNGAMINTGEKRLVLHQLTRGQLGEDVIADGINKREFYLNEQYVNLLFNEYSKEWAYTNALLTGVWLIFTWIGLYLIYK